MALKKSQLYSSLWRSCDELRGGMDASQYKDYVLTLLFMKYVSDRHAGRRDALIEVPAGGGFDDIAALKGAKDIGERINVIIRRFAEANDLQGVIDQADFDDDSRLGSGREMQDRLSKLVAIFEGLDFRANRAGGDDLLGDAYEYLMRHFATESGKAKGQFYTPAEVSRVMAQVIGIGPGTRQDQTIYDPTCGSGSLLLKAADQAPNGITVYGQEMDNATWALARMNMILHGHETAELHRGNTLAAPHFKNPDGGLKTFDFAVANPPFSAKAWSNGLDPAHDEFGRFEHGVPPARNGDYAFLLHLIKSLKTRRGKGAIILPHGVLFRGNREADIRRNLVRRGLVKGIIGLPPNLFYGTGIPACIVVIDKENAHARTGIFMVDASRGFRKDGNKNRLRAQDIHRIVDVFNRRTDVPRYSRMVPVSEIADPANDYNLNIPRYVDASAPEDLHDLDAHLNGGIPDRDLDALGAWWEVFPSLRAALFEGAGRPGYSRLRVDQSDIDAAIDGHPEVEQYRQQVTEVFDVWRDVHRPILRDLGSRDVPADVIDGLSENLLTCFADVPLIDPYQPVAKVGERAWPRRDRSRTLNDYGDGQETGGATGVAAVGDDCGSADERGTSLLRASEPGAGRGWVRRVRRGPVRGVLRGADGAAEPASWTVFPDAVHRVFRGPVFGAWDCVAGVGFTEPAVVPGPGCDRGGAGPLDFVSDASSDRRQDARGGVHVGSRAAVGGGSGQGQDGRRGCDDAGSERGDAEHRAPGHGRILRGVHSAVGGSVWCGDTDAGGAGSVRPVSEGQEDVEQGLAIAAGPGREDREDEGRPDALGPQGRARGGHGHGGHRVGDGAGCLRRRYGDAARDADDGGRAGRGG